MDPMFLRSEYAVTRPRSAMSGTKIDLPFRVALAEGVEATITEHDERFGAGTTKPQARCWASDLGLWGEPPVGVEPTTYSLRVNRSTD